jgi:hypothetical protein
MAYIFQIDELMPASVSGYVGIDSATFRYPLTPFWWRPGSAAAKRGIELEGADFFHQNSFAYDPRNNTGDISAICGNQTFRDYSWSLTWQTPPVTDTGSDSRYYDFSISLNPITDFGPINPANFYGSSATLSGYDQTTPPANGDGTLSNPVDADWLLGEIDGWDGLTHGSNNTARSFRTESDEGWRCIVSFFEARPQGYWFSGTPFGMVGDLGTLWNGLFSTFVIKETRKNFPTLWKTAQITSADFPVGPDSSTSEIGRASCRERV